MGRGVIQVSKALFEPRESEIIVQPQTLAEWHTLLMLPEDYRLLEAKMDAVYPYWNVTVEHEAIPSEVDGKLPELSPLYVSKDETHPSSLERIELHRYGPERKVIWQRSEQ